MTAAAATPAKSTQQAEESTGNSTFPNRSSSNRNTSSSSSPNNSNNATASSHKVVYHFDLSQLKEQEPPATAADRDLPPAAAGVAPPVEVCHLVGQDSCNAEHVVPIQTTTTARRSPATTTTTTTSATSATSADVAAAAATDPPTTLLDCYGRPKPHRLIRKWPSQLMYLMRCSTGDDEWLSVLQRIQTHPHEVAVQGVNGGMNALHAACVRYPPLTVVQACVRACPRACWQRNFAGETPLHIASYSCDETVPTFLVQTVPQAASILDQEGDAPLHYAVRQGASLKLLEQLLRAAPDMLSHRNQRGVSPFWLLPRSYLECHDLDQVLCHEDNEFGENYRDDWDCLALFLRVAHEQRNPAALPPLPSAARDPSTGLPLPIRRQDYTWMVHAAAAEPACPRQVLKWLCQRFPEQALTHDATGQTPLHWACSTPSWQEPHLRWNEIEDGIRERVNDDDDAAAGTLQNPNDRVDEHDMALPNMAHAEFLETVLFQQPADNAIMEEEEDDNDNCSHYSSNGACKESAIEILLEWSPKSALVTTTMSSLSSSQHQQWPLTLALRHGLDWNTAIRPLIAACPRALQVRDAESGLYNFQTAATCSPQLDTVFSLIRSLPELLLASVSVVGGDDDEDDKDSAHRTKQSMAKRKNAAAENELQQTSNKKQRSTATSDQ